MSPARIKYGGYQQTTIFNFIQAISETDIANTESHTMEKKRHKRVVITGMGLVSPLAANCGVSWERLIAGISGIKTLSADDYGNSPVRIGGTVPSYHDDNVGGLDISRHIPFREQKKADRFIQLALIAADEAIHHAGLQNLSEEDKLNVATIIATGIGGVHSITRAVNTVYGRENKRLSPFTIPSFIANLAAGHISIKYGYKGLIGTPVSACAAGIQAIGDGFNVIREARARIAVVGGSESCINPVSLGGFHAARALSTDFSDEPAKSSRPFDTRRDGFVMSEGAGVLILEELEHALNRGADILGEVKGYGTTSDAWHITAGPADGAGAARAMSQALYDAGLHPDEVDYINAHSTSTPVGDLSEISAIKSVFKNSFPFISSTKSSTGHMLGAAGAAASIFSVMAINKGLIPASLNIDKIDASAECLNIVKNKPLRSSLSHVLVNGFGFGGVNASIVFSAFTK